MEPQNRLMEQENLTKEIELIVTNLDQFSGGLVENIDQLDWNDRRDMIRRLVKRIELGNDDINVVYKVSKLINNLPVDSAQYCCNRMHGS